MIDGEDRSPAPFKIEAVSMLPLPHAEEELRAFLGMTG